MFFLIGHQPVMCPALSLRCAVTEPLSAEAVQAPLTMTVPGGHSHRGRCSLTTHTPPTSPPVERVVEEEPSCGRRGYVRLVRLINGGTSGE